MSTPRAWLHPDARRAHALQWTPEGDAAIRQARAAFEARLRSSAELDCASTGSSLVTAENVRQGASLVKADAPSRLSLVIDFAAMVLLGIGVNLVSAQPPQAGLGSTLLGLGAVLYLAAKLAVCVRGSGRR